MRKSCARPRSPDTLPGMPLRRLRQNRLPVAPPPLRHRVHSPSGAPRESALERVRRIASEHRATEKPFEPEKRGTWKGSSRDLVVNGSHRYTVIESKVWRGPNGRTASPYGAAPWGSEREQHQWRLDTVGWTVRNEDTGTVGIGRQPWKTKWEADDWVNQQNAKREARLAKNPHRARRGDKHGRETDEEFLVIEEEGSSEPGFILVNPLEYPRSKYARESLFALQFGAYGWTKLLVWASSAEDSLEEAAGWLKEFAPGIFTDEDSLREMEEDYREENPDADDDDVMDAMYPDHTYTESGYIPSWEWTLDEIDPGRRPSGGADGSLYDAAFEASKEAYEEQYGPDSD